VAGQKTPPGSDEKAPPRRTQRQRSEATTSDVLTAARKLFAQAGYGATSLDAIAAAAGLTKGAIYHHFSSKQEVFRAVYEQERARLSEIEQAAYSRKRDPWDGFIAACLAFLEASADPEAQRITLLDAPGALGWETIRELFVRDDLGTMVVALQAAMAAGRLRKRPIEPIAHLLHGALGECAMHIAHAKDQRAALRAASAEVRRLLEAVATG
jgi:AcrR family transcriptional regulator